MTYDDFRGKLFYDVETLTTYAELGHLDKLRALRHFAAYEASVEEEVASLSRRSPGRSRAKADSARDLLRAMRAGEIGVRLDGDRVVDLTAKVIAKELSRIAPWQKTGDPPPQSLSRTIAAAIEHRGATTRSVPNIQAFARRHGLPSLTHPHLGVLWSSLDGDTTGALELHESLTPSGSETARNAFLEGLRRGPLVEVVDNGTRVRSRVSSVLSSPVRQPQKVYLATDVVSALLLSGNIDMLLVPSNVIIPRGVFDEIEERDGHAASLLRQVRRYLPEPVAHHSSETVEETRRDLILSTERFRLAERTQHQRRGLAEAIALAKGDPSSVVVTDSDGAVRRAGRHFGIHVPTMAGAERYFAASTGSSREERLNGWLAYRRYATKRDIPVADSMSESFLASDGKPLDPIALRLPALPDSGDVEDRPLFYPDADFFIALVHMLRDDREAADVIIRNAGGQLMMTPGVRAAVKTRFMDRAVDVRVLATTEPIARRATRVPSAERVGRLAQAYSSRIVANADDQWRIASLAIVASLDPRGRIVFADNERASEMRHALTTVRQLYVGPGVAHRRAVSLEAMFGSIVRRDGLDASEREALVEASRQLFRRMRLDAPSRERLLEARAAENAGLLEGSGEVHLGTPQTNRNEADPQVLSGDVHEFTIADWANRALQTLARSLPSDRGSARTRISDNLALASTELEPARREAPWRATFVAPWTKSPIDGTTAEIIAREWMRPDTNSMADLFAQLADADPLTQRAIVVATEEAFVRRYFEELVDDTLEAVNDESRQQATDDQSVDAQLWDVLGRSVKLDSDSPDVMPGIIHAERAVKRTGEALDELVSRMSTSSDQEARLRTALRCIAATALVPASDQSAELRASVGAGLRGLRATGRERAFALVEATRSLLDDPEVEGLVMRFADTRVDATAALHAEIPTVDMADGIAAVSTTTEPVSPSSEVATPAPMQAPPLESATPDRPPVSAKPAPPPVRATPMPPPVRAKPAPPPRRGPVGSLATRQNDATPAPFGVPSLLGVKGEDEPALDTPASEVSVEQQGSPKPDRAQDVGNPEGGVGLT